MTIYNIDVSNGRACELIRTNGLSAGRYKIKANYLQNNYYNSSNDETHILTLNPRPPRSIDCTTISAWIRKSPRGDVTTAMLDDEGYITSVRDGNANDYYTVCDELMLKRNITVEIDFFMKSRGTHGYGLEYITSDSPTRFFVFNGQLQERHSNGATTTQNVANIPINTLTTIKYEIDDNGYIYLTDSNGRHASTTAFTDNELSSMKLDWKHWGSDKQFSIRRLTITENV